MGTIINNFRLLTWSSFIGQFVTEGRVCGRRFGWGDGYSLFQPDLGFILIENMKIWCNIQDIIYPFIKGFKSGILRDKTMEDILMYKIKIIG